MSRLGFIGTGHIAAPMARHLAGKGHEIAVTRRNTAVSSALRDELGVTVAEPQEVLDTAEIVLLCLRPHQAEAVLAPLAFRADQRVISVMASVSADDLARLCAPASRFVQTVPLGFVEAGGCPLAAYGAADLLTELFAPENPVVPVASEAALNAHFAVCAFVAGMLDVLDTASAWLADRTGDDAGAEHFTTQLAAGFLAAMEKGRAGSLAAERDALATPDTLSLQMVEALRESGAHDALRDALTAIGKRLEAA